MCVYPYYIGYTLNRITHRPRQISLVIPYRAESITSGLFLKDFNGPPRQVFTTVRVKDGDLRGLSLTEEDAGEGELQRGRHHLLRQGLELEFDVRLCGHWTGVLFHVYAAGG